MTDAKVTDKHVNAAKGILGGYGIQVWERESDNTRVLSPVAMKIAQALANAERDGRKEGLEDAATINPERFIPISVLGGPMEAPYRNGYEACYADYEKAIRALQDKPAEDNTP